MADTTISTGLDIMSRYQQATTGMKDGEFDPTINRTEAQEKYDQMYKDRTTLDFTDMLSLMIAQFQNQTIDNQADTSDMMNQLTQMTSMQAMNEMVAQMQELTTANILSYSASLVGKTVTVGVYNSETKKLEEIVGEVEGAGTYDGQQVIFIGGKSYLLSSIMAVGTLPPPKEDPKPDESGDGEGDGTGTDNKTDGTNTDNKTDGTGNSTNTGGGESSEDDGAVG